MDSQCHRSARLMVTPLAVAATALIALLMSPAHAATTGQLSGFVVDSDGSPLPAVRVSASSPTQIGGVQVTETDLQGWFQYPRLIPGYFTVRLELDGFLTQELTRVQVRLDRMTQVHVTLPLATFGEGVTVTETTPVVDPERVATGQSFTGDFMAEAAIGTDMRSLYWQVALLAAGVSNYPGDETSAFGFRVFGSSPQENIFQIDGLDTSNPVSGGAQITLPFDSVQEVAFESGGYGAEHGRGVGGVLNAVTKSGSNVFSGTVDMRYADSDFSGSGEHFDPDESSISKNIASATLGGRFIRDRAWFFGAVENQSYEFTAKGAPTTEKEDRYHGFLKVTGQITPNWLALGKYQVSPYEWLGPSDPLGTPEIARRYEEKQSVLQAEVSGVLSGTMLWELQLGSQSSDVEYGPASGDSSAIGHFNLDTGIGSGNSSSVGLVEDSRDQISTYLTWFIDDALGSHKIKFGGEYLKTSYWEDTCRTGIVGGGFCREGERGFSFFDFEDTEGNSIPYLMNSDPARGPYGSEGTLPALFVQDSWRVRRDVTLQLGLRWDRSIFDSDVGEELADLELLQPRVGVTWDVTGNGRNLLRASWGRFMHSSDLELPRYPDLLFQNEAWLSCSFKGLDEAGLCAEIGALDGLDWRLDSESWDPAGWLLISTWNTEPGQVDRDLEPTYADTLIVGFERELFRRTSLELSFVDKTTRDIFDDTCNGNLPTPSPDADCSYFILANIPMARRDYQGWILNFESRAVDRLHVLASYTNSDEKGNHAFKSINTNYFDLYPYHFVNTYGYLPSHRKHRIKASGYVFLPLDFGIGFNGFWGSPFRWSQVEDAVRFDPGAWGLVFTEPRGSREGEDFSQLDVQLTKGFSLGRSRLKLIGSVLNLFDSENATRLCIRASGCGDFELGDPIAWQQPRRYELGVRVEF